MNKKQYVKPELTEVVLDSQISIQTASTETGGTGGTSVVNPDTDEENEGEGGGYTDEGDF